MMKLFWAPGTCALASHIALGEAGAQVETVTKKVNPAPFTSTYRGLAGQVIRWQNIASA